MKYFIFSLLLLSLNSFGATFPDSFKATSWSIEEGEDLGSELDKKSFEDLIVKVFSLYQINNMNRDLRLGVVDWSIPYFSAWAHEKEDVFSINFWGGFARIPSMTKKAFVLTICHEIGHVLGGEPYHLIEDSKNMSAEGQSDFFASAICMKKYLREFEAYENVDGLHPIAAARCYEKYQLSVEGKVCETVAKAGQDLTDVLGFLDRDQIFSYETPSELIVERTLYNSYPTIQCRLDTFLAGAISSQFEQDLNSLRPKCWYHHKN